METLTEVLKQADQAQDIKSLHDLYKKFIDNKFSYCVVDLEFGQEHFVKLSGEMARRDAKIDADFLKSMLGI